MPRFSIEYRVGLNEPLKLLGMGLAFEPDAAEFSAMCPSCTDPLYIQSVSHCASLEVNEEGTEATAVTRTSMLGRMAPSQPDPVMCVDRPFFVTIRDDPSGSLLFAGAIYEGPPQKTDRKVRSAADCCRSR